MRIFSNKLTRVNSYFVCLIVLASNNFAVAADFDCSPLDPRVSVSKEQEGNVNVAVKTLYKLAEGQGTVKGKLKQQIQNLQQGIPASDQLTIKLRTLWLFCGMVVDAKDMTTERKIQLLQDVEKVAPATTLKISKPKQRAHNNKTSPSIPSASQSITGDSNVQISGSNNVVNPAAIPKPCRDKTHGVESYGRTFEVDRYSNWMGGGYSQDPWCNEVLAGLRGEHPEGAFEVVAKSEKSKDTCPPFNCPQYMYYCKVQVKTDPIYVERLSSMCK